MFNSKVASHLALLRTCRAVSRSCDSTKFSLVLPREQRLLGQGARAFSSNAAERTRVRLHIEHDSCQCFPWSAAAHSEDDQMPHST
eukprot:6458-Heterococcus_DN1.PRE.1